MTTAAVFTSRKNGGSLTTKGGGGGGGGGVCVCRAQGSIVLELKGIFRMMSLLNPEAGVKDQI